MITPIKSKITPMKDKDQLTEQIISSCFTVHNELGPGFHERIYQGALVISLKQNNLNCISEKEFKVYFQNNLVGRLKIDLIINDKVIVEVKAVAGILPRVFQSQVISYLKASGLKVGLLVNFGNSSCQIKRLVS